MAAQRDNGMAILATATIGAYLLVKFDGTLCAADATDDWVGVSQEPRVSGQYVPVRFIKGRTSRMVAAAAITKGALVYKDAAGTVGVTNTNAFVGKACEAASGAGAIFEVLN